MVLPCYSCHNTHRDIVSGIGVRGAVILAGTAGCQRLSALFVFYKGLALGEVSYVAPISKIVPVFVLPLEVVFLDQQLSAIHVIGVGVATGAVYVANYRRGSLLDPLRRLRQSKAALLALAAQLPSVLLMSENEPVCRN